MPTWYQLPIQIDPGPIWTIRTIFKRPSWPRPPKKHAHIPIWFTFNLRNWSLMWEYLGSPFWWISDKHASSLPCLMICTSQDYNDCLSQLIMRWEILQNLCFIFIRICMVLLVLLFFIDFCCSPSSIFNAKTSLREFLEKTCFCPLVLQKSWQKSYQLSLSSLSLSLIQHWNGTPKDSPKDDPVLRCFIQTSAPSDEIGRSDTCWIQDWYRVVTTVY